MARACTFSRGFHSTTAAFGDSALWGAPMGYLGRGHYKQNNQEVINGMDSNSESS